MQVTNTNQRQTITKTIMNTQQLTNEDIILIKEILPIIKEILPRFGSVERLIEAHTEDIALLKAKKSGKSKKRVLTEDEIAAKQREEEAKVAKKLAASKAKVEREELKAAKVAKKAAKALEREALAAKKAQDKSAKTAKKEAIKLEKEKIKADKAANKGPSFDKTFTKKCFVKYRDYKDNQSFLSMGGSRLRIARKKDGSDTTVYKVAPQNWTDEANAEFDALENKWDASAKPYSPEFVPKKSAAKSKKAKKKKTFIEQVAVDDTDEELSEEKPVEEIPKDYNLYRRYLKNDKTAETTWRKANHKANQGAIKVGLHPLDNWAYKKTASSNPFADKIYDTDPEAKVVDEGKGILNENDEVVGNCVSSFTQAEDKKPAAVEPEVESEVESEVEDQVLGHATISEFDEDGMKPYNHPMYFDKKLRIRESDNAVFDSEKPLEEALIGYYNPETGEIGDELEESEDDGFSSDDMKDNEQF